MWEDFQIWLINPGEGSLSLLWLDTCDTLLSLLADCNFSLAFPCANPLKAVPGKKAGKKNTLMIYLVSYLKLKKNMRAHFKSSHLLWVYMNELSCTDRRGGVCELYVSTKSISKANRYSKSNATRQRTISSLHRWGASSWPGLNDLPKVKQLTVSGLWHIPDLMNQMLAPETPTSSIILQKMKRRVPGYVGICMRLNI